MRKQKCAIGLVSLALILTFAACGNKGTGDPISLGGGGGPPEIPGGGGDPPKIPGYEWIKPGTFSMGQEGVATPVHNVTLTQGFYMAKYQVTQKLWRAVMGDGEDRTTSTYGKGDNYPVYNVSWYDALVFCNKLSMAEGLTPAYRIRSSTDPSVWGSVPTSNNTTWNNVEVVAGSKGYRLPTEAQWEYACRAGTTSVWYTGNAENAALQAAAWYYANSNSKTHEVGQKTPNNFGLYDMHGNVFEWCWDWSGSYSAGAQTDPTGATSGSVRISRGGSWTHNAVVLRSAVRYASIPSLNYPYWRTGTLGFRVVRPN